jgi:cobalt-zinc-cadmium efflux system membrane fusion protein
MGLAEQAVERERKLRAENISSGKEHQEAEAAYRMAVQQLKTLGFADEQLKTIAREPDQATLEIRAPFAGEIIERNAVRGTLVEAGRPLFALADLSEMWAALHIPESQLTRLRVGQAVELRVHAIPLRRFRGTLTWIGARVDERTRMGQARAAVANPEGLLRAGLFARAQVVTATSDRAVLVPHSAVQTHGGKSLVFLKAEEDLYEARCVRVGAMKQDQLVILEGLSADDRVVVARSYALKSEMLKSRLGAGCSEE